MRLPFRRAGGMSIGKSLSNPNVRKFIVGQGSSMLGGWMQATAVAWLVLDLTSSPMALGYYSLIRFAPMMVFGAYGGLLADRFSRLKLMRATQVILLCGSLVLVVLTLLPEVPILWVYGVAFVTGCVNAVDNPLRRAFIRELATDEELPNAIALNSTVATVMRTAGPAIGGLTIALLGVTWNFAINASTFVVFIVALSVIDRSTIRVSPATPRAKGQVRDGLAYAVKDDRIWTVLVIATVVGTFAWNYGVLMPVYATETFSGGARLYGGLLAVVGVGAFSGALLAARRGTMNHGGLVRAVGLVSIALFLVSLAPSVVLAVGALLLLGAAGTTVVITSQTNLQLQVKDVMSGRILALYSIAFVGSKPIGGLLCGWLMEISNARVAFATCAGIVGFFAISMWAYEVRVRGWRWRFILPYQTRST